MARPLKDGLDYFSLDVTLDTKFELIEAEFGLTGFAVIIKLYQEIYKNGYYCNWNQEVALLFAKKNGLGGNVVSEIVKSALKREIFNYEKFKQFGILTSSGIQKRYIEAAQRRKNFKIKSEYLLVQCACFSENVNNNGVNVDINSKNVCNNPQSKVKESKVKESKVKESREDAPAFSIPTKNGNDYIITKQHLHQLQKQYKNINVSLSLSRLCLYFENNPDKRLYNYDKKIEIWLTEDEEKADKKADEKVSYDLELYEKTSIFD